MKQTLIIITTLLSIAGFGQNLDCEKFKTGTFYYPAIPEYGYSIRDKKTQKSYVKSKDMWVTWKVKWTDECNFEMTYLSAENSDGVYKKGDKITTAITAVDKDCYTFSSVFFSDKYPEGKQFPPTDMCIKHEEK